MRRTEAPRDRRDRPAEGFPALQLLPNREQMPANEIARLAEVAIGREHEREERLGVDRSEHQAYARKRHDHLADRAPGQRVRGFADLLEDARELDAGTADVLLERPFRNPVGDVLLDRNPVRTHQHGSETAAALLDDAAQDRSEAHGLGLRTFSSQRSSVATTEVLPGADASGPSGSPSAARIRAAPRRSPCRSSSSAIVRVANAPLDASGLWSTAES